MTARWKNTLSYEDVTPKQNWLNRRQIMAGGLGLGIASAFGSHSASAATLTPNSLEDRSEERRVGKEC